MAQFAKRQYQFDDQVTTRAASGACPEVCRRMAMRQGSSAVYFLLGDHLGSTSLPTCGSGSTCGGNGTEVSGSRTLYYPYGEVRWPTGGSTLATDYTFTGQRNEASFGLMDYNARYYDPALGRFIQADTIVPSPANPQSLNRYAYTLNNPLRYTDPTGHFTDDELAALLAVCRRDLETRFLGLS